MYDVQCRKCRVLHWGKVSEEFQVENGTAQSPILVHLGSIVSANGGSELDIA